jgi:HK97 family phage portal protein
MTLIGRLFERRSLEDPNVPLTPNEINSLFSVPNVDSGVNVTERTAMQMSTVWRCVNILANAAASTPLRAYRDGSYDEVPNTLLDQPHPEMTPFEFWRLTYVHRLLWGNHYSEKIKDGAGRIRYLYPLDPSKVKVGRASDGTKVFDVTRTDGRVVSATSAEVFHLPGIGFDGIKGVSPIQQAAQGIGLSLAAERHGAQLFGSGTHLSGILSVGSSLTQKQADAAKARWKAKMSGPSAAHDIAILDNDAKFQPISMPNTDAQYIESRGFQTNELCRWYGVPPYMVGDVEKSTSWGTGIEQQGIGFVVYTLRPDWLVPTEQRITKELLQDPKVYARYNVEGLLRGDSTARANFYKTMREIGAYSVNDILTAEKRPPIGPEGDTRIQPLNFAPLGTTLARPGSTDTPDPSDPSTDPAKEGDA